MNLRYKRNYIKFELNWNVKEPEIMKAICPKLFDKTTKINPGNTSYQSLFAYTTKTN